MKCCHSLKKATSSGKTSLPGSVIIYPFFSNGSDAFFAMKVGMPLSAERPAPVRMVNFPGFVVERYQPLFDVMFYIGIVRSIIKIKNSIFMV